MAQLALRVGPIAAVRCRVLDTLDWPHIFCVYIRIAEVVVGTHRGLRVLIKVRGKTVRSKVVKQEAVVLVELRAARTHRRDFDAVPPQAYAGSPVKDVHGLCQLRRGVEHELVAFAAQLARVRVLEEGGPHHGIAIRVDVADLSDTHENVVHVAAVSERRL